MLLYLYTSLRYETKDKGIDHFRIFYAARDSSDRREFIVEFYTDEEGVVWPMVNGMVDYRFPVSAIYDRFRLLDKYIKSKELPPKDFEMCWSAPKIEKYYAVGDIGKTKYEKWKKNPTKNPIGSWVCNYCNFSSFCWDKDGKPKC